MPAHLPERSEPALREALRRACPALAASTIDLPPLTLHPDPAWRRATARVGDAHVVKFAWSETAAEKLAYEISVMWALAGTAAARHLPEVTLACLEPALLVTRLAAGRSLTREALADPRLDLVALAGSMADALAALHAPAVLAAVEGAGVALLPPRPQASTARLRAQLLPLLEPGGRRRVERWCDWVDAVQAQPTEATLLHGDFHGHNLLCGADGGTVVRLLDYEEAALGDFHYDLRYLPAQAPRLDLLVEVVERYEGLTGRRVEPANVMAWHVRTVLGDALWRTQAGAPLPDGGTVAGWIASLHARLREVDAWRPMDGP
jgi:aminoglycoside phosphotransferase (APT) family kinase protein